MKVSEIKSTIRYCIGKLQESGIIVDHNAWFNVLWNVNTKKWEPYDIVCPLSTLLLMRQLEPTAENLAENWTKCTHPEHDKGLCKNCLDRLSPDSLASNTIKTFLDVSDEFIYGFMDGVQNLPLINNDKAGWETGNYFYKRLTNQEEK